ncbi:hypothetical protein GCM10015535_21650 [Streptomyces gelaticus]|uniref:Uncharacterized protein n=1 Tax=Streptomyces gelaticus TaxID=285446 RepID=A0ABQ2VW83_9ACTN|nr:hypothetical protein GCM10015535_21650 [Streptomyces gelaticus]
MQVGCGREPDADQIVRDKTVALQDGVEQGTDPLVHVPGLVLFQLDGSADRSYRHVVLLGSSYVSRLLSACVISLPGQPRGGRGGRSAVLCR